MRLRAQQTAFADAVTGAHPADGALVTPGPRLGAAERVEIYRDGYRARLVECLADDYAAVRSAIGADAFEAAARGYIDAYPSRSPSLNAFGRAMPDFLEEFLARDPGAVPARFAVDSSRGSSGRLSRPSTRRPAPRSPSSASSTWPPSSGPPRPSCPPPRRASFASPTR